MFTHGIVGKQCRFFVYYQQFAYLLFIYRIYIVLYFSILFYKIMLRFCCVNHTFVHTNNTYSQKV